MKEPNMILTSEQVTEKLARAEAAVQGPWAVHEEQVDRTIIVAHQENCQCGLDVDTWCGGGHVVVRIHDKKRFFNNRLHDPANLEFIAAARTDVPELCQSNEALRTRADAAEAKVAFVDELRTSEGKRRWYHAGILWDNSLGAFSIDKFLSDFVAAFDAAGNSIKTPECVPHE